MMAPPLSKYTNKECNVQDSLSRPICFQDSFNSRGSILIRNLSLAISKEANSFNLNTDNRSIQW